MESNSRTSLTVVSVILAAGLIIAAIVISSTWRGISRSNVTITVTGSASKEITSDLAVWNGSFSSESSSMTDAYSRLEQNNRAVKNYLVSKGYSEDVIKMSSINSTTLYQTNASGYSTNIVSGYRLSQEVSVASNDVDKIDQLSREVTELINQGIEIYSYPPQFYYTKIGDLKVEMIGLAAEDAKQRAEQIANSTDNKVGDVRSSRMGVIQITAKNSTEISDYGINDTSSLEKTITAVVSMSFEIR
jgi:uncharacterized protein